MKFRLVLYSIAIVGITSCGDDTKKEGEIVENQKHNGSDLGEDCPAYIRKNKSENLNVSILLDLSDRIEQPKSVEKDVAYLSSLSNAFVDHIKTNQKRREYQTKQSTDMMWQL